MLSRLQVCLDPDTRRKVAKKAAAAGISMSEYVRRVIASDLDPAKKQFDVSEIFDLGRSDGTTSIATDKDRMIAEAILAGRK
jgi:hypothetical protein